MQWRSKGGQVEANALGPRAWGRISTLLQLLKNAFLSKNLDQNMLMRFSKGKKKL